MIGACPAGANDATGLYIAEPVSAATGKPLDPARAGTVRVAVEKAFKGFCRRIVEVDPGLGRIDPRILLQLSRGIGVADPKSVRSEVSRDLLAIGVLKAGRHYQISMAAIDLRNGQARGKAKAQAKGKRGLAEAARAVATLLRAKVPCPAWHGEIVLVTRESRAEKKGGLTRTGQVEWTAIVKISGLKTNLAGRYKIDIKTRKCGRGGKPPCGTTELSGTGPVTQSRGYSSLFKVKPDGRYEVAVGDTIARVRMKQKICDAKGSCRLARFETEQLLRGGRASGREPAGATEIFGAAKLANTKTLKKTLTWQLENRLD